MGCGASNESDPSRRRMRRKSTHHDCAHPRKTLKKDWSDEEDESDDDV